MLLFHKKINKYTIFKINNQLSFWFKFKFRIDNTVLVFLKTEFFYLFYLLLIIL